MKKIIFKFSFVFLSILLMSPAHSMIKPFVYSAEKGGKTIYLLGTFHEGVSITELPCSNEILARLNTSDLIFSELSESYLTLLKHLGDSMEQVLTASASEREEMLRDLPEPARADVNEIIELYDRQRIEMFQKMFGRVQLVDKEKEPFEALRPPVRDFLISRGVDVQGSYVDYLYLIFSALMIENFFRFSRLDSQIAEMAYSKNIHIKPLDNAYSNNFLLLDAFIPSSGKADEMEVTEIEVDSRFIDTLIAGFSNMIDMLNSSLFNSSMKENYLSGDEEALLQYSGILDDTAERVLLKERNPVWFQKLKDAFEGHDYESIFLAGGALHLIGPFNVLDRLREDEFTVQRLGCYEIM